MAERAMIDARSSAAALAEAAWELRRRCYAAGWLRPRGVPARVVSVGNLTLGGAGKTTLTLHLARRAQARGVDAHVVCRRYRPGPGGEGDEERLYRAALGPRAVHAGRVKRALAGEAARAGAALVLVDDGFSHWGLERDLDLVLIDSQDPWGGGGLFPAGRLREPRRALQRAEIVVLTRLTAGVDPAPLFAEIRRYAPAAQLASGRHALRGFRALDGAARERPERVRIVTATGNPGAVARTAAEAGCEVAGCSAYRDHHWFSSREAETERTLAAGQGATLLLTAKDAVRWPAVMDEVSVMEIEWAWSGGGDEVERRVFAVGGTT